MCQMKWHVPIEKLSQFIWDFLLGWRVTSLVAVGERNAMSLFFLIFEM